MPPIRLITDQAIAELNNTREDALGFSSYAGTIARIVRGTRGPFTKRLQPDFDSYVGWSIVVLEEGISRKGSHD